MISVPHLQKKELDIYPEKSLPSLENLDPCKSDISDLSLEADQKECKIIDYISLEDLKKRETANTSNLNETQPKGAVSEKFESPVEVLQTASLDVIQEPQADREKVQITGSAESLNLNHSQNRGTRKKKPKQDQRSPRR